VTFLGGKGFKLSEPHHPECLCENDEDSIVFIVPDGTEYRDTIGRKGGSHTWYRFRCNDPDCEARMLVRWDVLSEFVSTEGGYGRKL
jgi:hypothetical protein